MNSMPTAIVVMQFPAEDAIARWDEISPFIERARVRSHAEWEVDEVKDMVASGTAAVIAAGASTPMGTTVLAVIVLVIEESWRGRSVLVLSAAGRAVKAWLPAFEQFVSKFAKENDCSRVEIMSGRKGWARVLARTWKLTGVSMELCHGA